ncbi:DDB1- and CUL4-associated factor 4 [Octopus bimaculoides]|uniref:Uncharacterized protein n=1 Tax=Octopus bimaculoides TaxID=37653 RepID=A0A0L8GNM7_OCTBM|nr:DDB1- and CUL4-associated factor 4 [Octopus bimaculoides]|eukprot:XP_014779472.1 PREDICTED: DDB1- and CUL4-associated factor 4-like [Octopus bimaculoides]
MSDFRGRKKGKWGKKENEYPSSATMSVSYDNASSGQRASTFSPSPSTSKSTPHNDTANTQVTSGIHSQKFGSKLSKKPKNGPSIDPEMSCKYFSKGRKRKFPPNKKHWKSYFNNKPKDDYTERNHTDEVPSTSYGSASKSNDHKELELAGYYYDTEQEKYFKILPGHSSLNVFTKAKIIAKETEEKRQKDLIKMRDSPCSLPKVSHFKNNITLWLEQMKVGSINNTQMGIFQLRKNIAGLKPFWHEKVFPSEFGPYEQLKHCLQLLVSPLCDDIVGSWTVQKFLKQRLQLIHIKRRTPTKDNNTIPIEIDPFGTSILHSWGQVSSSCWAPFSDNPDERWVLYTTSSAFGLLDNFALIRNFKPRYGENFYIADYNLGKTFSWTCAWNQNTKQFSVGAEKTAYLLDVETKKKWELNSRMSDVLSQVFAQQTDSTLVHGTRQGDILVHDLRIQSSKHAAVMEQHNPVCSLNSLQNGYHVIAADFKGQIKLWDFRKKRTLHEYTGHVNKHCHLPVHIDHSERFLYAVGQDCYSRFWDMKTGILLKSIPPPHPCSLDFIPAIHYSDHWAGLHGNSAMLMAIKDEFHLYACDISE